MKTGFQRQWIGGRQGDANEVGRVILAGNVRLEERKVFTRSPRPTEGFKLIRASPRSNRRVWAAPESSSAVKREKDQGEKV